MQWRTGDKEALDELMPLVYEDLKRVAYHRIHSQASLGATDVVHEVYARLVAAEVEWQDRVHFFAISANMMRNILVDHARARHRAKRGGDWAAVTFREEDLIGAESAEELLALDRALDELSELDERKVKVVELHYFAGLSQTDIAQALEISIATVERDLKMSRAFLQKALSAS